MPPQKVIAPGNNGGRKSENLTGSADILLDTRRGRPLLFCIRKVMLMAQYDDCIIFLLAKAYQKAHSNFKRHLLPYGVTPLQHLILETLWEEEGLTASEIGKRLVLDNATLSGILDRMSEKGLVVKASDEADKRFIRIHLTEKAKDLQPSLVPARESSNGEILGNLTLEEKVLLKRLLKDIRE